MRNLMLTCAGLALLGGVVSATLWVELRHERERSAALLERLDERAGSAVVTPAAPPVYAQSTSAGVQAPTAVVPGAASPSSAATEPPARPAAPQPEVVDFVQRQQELMKDPEYRRARLAQTRMQIPQQFPGLAEELELSPDQADRLFDLLAEQQLEMNDVSMLAATINGVQPDPAVAEDANRRRMEMQRRHEEALYAMVPGGQPQWMQYQQTRGARQQVLQLGRTLEAVGVPLSAEQSRPLAAIYVAEQARQREDAQRMMLSMRQAAPQDATRQMEERFRMQAESNRRLVNAARPHLNAQQLEALQASLEQQLAMNRATTRLMQQQPSGQVPTITSISIAAPAPAAP